MTSTDLDIQQQPNSGMALTPTAPEQITQALDQWVGGMALSVRGAEYIVDTPMCPDSFWPLPANVTSCRTPKQPIGNEDRASYLARRQVATYTLGSVVRYGLQLGLPPEVAVQGIFIVGGRTGMYAEQMVALVKSRGHGHRVIERSRTSCIVEVWRAGETDRERFEFSIDDAIAAGYVPNQGPNAGDHGKWPDGKPKKSPGNAKYVTDPAAMLYARVTSIACRTKFPDVLQGLVTAEEMQDEQRSQPVDITASVEVSGPAPARASAAVILAAATPAPEPVVAQAVQEPAREPEGPRVERAVLPITASQERDLGSILGQLNVSGAGSKARRLAIASAIAGRPLGSARDLTADEATVVINTLASIHDEVPAVRRRMLSQLDGTAADEAAAAQADAAAAQADAADEAAQVYAAQADDYDPSMEPGYGEMDGAEAAAEGQP